LDLSTSVARKRIRLRDLCGLDVHDDSASIHAGDREDIIPCPRHAKIIGLPGGEGSSMSRVLITAGPRCAK